MRDRVVLLDLKVIRVIFLSLLPPSRSRSLPRSLSVYCLDLKVVRVIFRVHCEYEISPFLNINMVQHSTQPRAQEKKRWMRGLSNEKSELTEKKLHRNEEIVIFTDLPCFFRLELFFHRGRHERKEL